MSIYVTNRTTITLTDANTGAKIDVTGEDFKSLLLNLMTANMDEQGVKGGEQQNRMITALVAMGLKLEAIAHLRKAVSPGCGLKEAKEEVNRIEAALTFPAI